MGIWFPEEFVACSIKSFIRFFWPCIYISHTHYNQLNDEELCSMAGTESLCLVREQRGCEASCPGILKFFVTFPWSFFHCFYIVSVLLLFVKKLSFCSIAEALKAESWDESSIDGAELTFVIWIWMLVSGFTIMLGISCTNNSGTNPFFARKACLRMHFNHTLLKRYVGMEPIGFSFCSTLQCSWKYMH